MKRVSAVLFTMIFMLTSVISVAGVVTIPDKVEVIPYQAVLFKADLSDGEFYLWLFSVKDENTGKLIPNYYSITSWRRYDPSWITHYAVGNVYFEIDPSKEAATIQISEIGIDVYYQDLDSTYYIQAIDLILEFDNSSHEILVDSIDGNLSSIGGLQRLITSRTTYSEGITLSGTIFQENFDKLESTSDTSYITLGFDIYVNK